MTNSRPTWENKVKTYFTQEEIGCMSTVKATPPLDLGDYDSVVAYINASEANKQRFGVAMELGDEGRKQIKGNSLDHYLSTLQEVREKTLVEFKKRDDKWFAEVDPSFFVGQPTNNFCKWFHVCEHEANHRGQMTVIRKRLPGKETKGE